MAAILSNAIESFDQIVNILLTEGPMWNLVKKILNRFQTAPKILMVAKQFYFLNHTL